MASIMFALFFAIIMRGFQRGSYDKMKENAVEAYSGYLKIQKKGYWDDKNINNSFTLEPETIAKLSADPRVKELIPRLETFALASSGESTKGVVVMGIDPEREGDYVALFWADGFDLLAVSVIVKRNGNISLFG